jgi:hypothetical protein
MPRPKSFRPAVPSRRDFVNLQMAKKGATACGKRLGRRNVNGSLGQALRRFKF